MCDLRISSDTLYSRRCKYDSIQPVFVILMLFFVSYLIVIYSIIGNLGNGWGYEMTPAELAKKDEFYSIYWSEYNFVKENGSSELREMPDYLDQDRPSFEARA